MLNRSKLDRWCDAVLEAGWLAAVVVAPLFFNVFSSRVFEPDKISLIRTLALTMAVAWLIKVANGGFAWLPPAPGGLPAPGAGGSGTTGAPWIRSQSVLPAPRGRRSFPGRTGAALCATRSLFRWRC